MKLVNRIAYIRKASEITNERGVCTPGIPGLQLGDHEFTALGRPTVHDQVVVRSDLRRKRKCKPLAHPVRGTGD
jgi:hypothetical protein